MTSLRLATFAVAASMLASCANAQEVVPDEWRYVPADSGASAELGEMGVYGFRIRCILSRHELFFEYFPGDGGPGNWTEEARNSGIVLTLLGVGGGDDVETNFEVHGPVTENSVTGTLPLTVELSNLIAEAPTIWLYGENKLSNVTDGGAALRRVLTECAPPQTGPKHP